jgi:hypothetical protein
LQSGEDCSGILLAPQWSNLLHEKPFFSHVVSSDEIAPREILLLEESSAGFIRLFVRKRWNLFKEFNLKDGTLLEGGMSKWRQLSY